MNARTVILAIGAVMATAGVLIELTGYVTSSHTAAGEINPTPRRPETPWSGNSGSENPLPPSATTTRPAQVRADDPYLAVNYLYRAIANRSATGCVVFSAAAAQQFATHFNAPDCPAAITQLATQVTSAINYASTAWQSPDVYPDDTMTISSCKIKPEGGPSLGRFTLQRTNDKWYISGHETETC